MKLITLIIISFTYFEVFSCCLCTNSWVSITTQSLSEHSLVVLSSRDDIKFDRDETIVLQGSEERIPLELIKKHEGDNIYEYYFKLKKKPIKGDRYYLLIEDSVNRSYLKAFSDTTASVINYLKKKYSINSKELSLDNIYNRQVSKQVVDSTYNPWSFNLNLSIYSMYDPGKLPFKNWVARKNTPKLIEKEKLFLSIDELEYYKEKDRRKLTHNFAKLKIKGLKENDKTDYFFEFLVEDISTGRKYNFYESKYFLEVGSVSVCGGNFKLEKKHSYQVSVILHDVSDGSKTKLNPIQFTWEYN